jgi:hypothetical protein
VSADPIYHYDIHSTEPVKRIFCQSDVLGSDIGSTVIPNTVAALDDDLFVTPIYFFESDELYDTKIFVYDSVTIAFKRHLLVDEFHHQRRVNKLLVCITILQYTLSSLAIVADMSGRLDRRSRGIELFFSMN